MKNLFTAASVFVLLVCTNKICVALDNSPANTNSPSNSSVNPPAVGNNTTGYGQYPVAPQVGPNTNMDPQVPTNRLTEGALLNQTNRATDPMRQPTASESLLTNQIREDLRRDPTFSTYSQNVTIDNMNGQITLRGQVRSQAEEQALINRVRAMNGVSDVRSELMIRR